ncbi:uncharacterized protein FPRN_15032 [Fusarium proliferatum]|nr:uncharacterized protein FPRN_15032 [Fusarium proliferatum]
MAVLPGVPGIEVRILVNGLPTEEWPFEGNITTEASEGDIKTDEHKASPAGLEDAPLPTRHSYIVSKSGCRFGVSLALSPDLKTSSLPAMTGGIGIEIYIDGTFYNRFPIDDHDNDKIEADMACVKTMGTIRLTVCAITAEKSVVYEVTETPMRPARELAHKTTILHGQGFTRGTTWVENEDTDGTDCKRSGGTILRICVSVPIRIAHIGAKANELDLSVEAKMKHEEVRMPDGKSLVDLTGHDDE